MGAIYPEIERKIFMRHTLVKLMGLLLVLTLVLTGCNLIGVDPMLQLDEDFAKLDKDYATVVAEYDGGTVTKGMPAPMILQRLYAGFIPIPSRIPLCCRS